MFDGTQKLLKDIVIGDELLGYHVDGMLDEEVPGWEQWTTDIPTSGELVPVTVTSAVKDTYHEYYIINNDIKVTKSHPFFASTDGITWGWIDTPNLKVGDKMMDVNKNTIDIDSISFVIGAIDVVTLDVENEDNYFAANILVHNNLTKN